MTDQKKTEGSARQARLERQSAALRANLFRRKAQERARREFDTVERDISSSPPPSPETGPVSEKG